MSDKYIVINGFRYGLDTRRLELSAQPGQLETCENAHINSGGEAEKRKAFVPIDRDNFAWDGVPFPTNTFGLQDTDSGLVTFGSDVAANATLPSGVTYQRLIPDFLSVVDSQIVSLAGTSVANGTYPHNGYLVGKAFYGDFATQWMGWSGFKWSISVVAGPLVHEYYYSLDNVDRPDQVTTWVLNSGVAPLPTVTYVPTTLAQMSEVVYSTNYLGKAFVIAKFGDTATGTHFFTFCFYDGQLVKPTRNGLVLINGSDAVETISNLSSDLASQFNDITDWLAQANVVPTYVTGVATKPDAGGYHTNASAGATLIYSPVGVHAELIPSVNSTLGLMGAVLIDQNFDGVAAKGASASFEVSGGVPTDTLEVTAPRASAGSGTFNLTNGPVTWVTSNAATATAIALAINNNTYITGYVAIASGVKVTVSAPSSWGAITFNLTVTTIGTVIAVVSATPPAPIFTATARHAHVTAVDTGTRPRIINGVAVGGGKTVLGALIVETTGSVGLVTYAWTETYPDGAALVVGAATPSGMSLGTPTLSILYLSKFMNIGETANGWFKCVVTDAGQPPGTTPISVYFSITMQLLAP